MIYIIIPVFNRKALTRECLCSIEEQGYKNFKIVVVDHGSTDGTSEMIMKHFSEVIILKGDESMWWTAATNIGIKKALSLSSSDHDFILTLNNDLIVDIDYLNQLLKVYEINKPCIVGSVSVDIKNPNKISYIGLKWNKITAKYKPNSCINIIYKNVVNCFDFIESDTLPGRGTLIPITIFKQIGLYDEFNFPHYAADEDYSLMAKENGYKLLVSTKAVVRSHIDKTGINVKDKLNFRNFLLSLKVINSANNLKYRYRWAKKHARFTLIYFLFDCGRIFGSYFRMLLKK